MYFLWQCPSFSLLPKWRFCWFVFGPVTVGPDSSLSAPQSSPISDCCLFHALSSHCSISPRTSANSRFSYGKNPQSIPAPSSPSAQPFFGFLEEMDAGSVSQRLQIGRCTDRLHMWTRIFWSFCATQSTAWHDRHIELILIPCCVQDLAMLKWSVLRHQMWLFYVVVAYHVRFLDWVKCNSVCHCWFFLFVFLFSCKV